MKKYGYKPEIVTPDQFVLGANSTLPKIILQSNGQWDDFLPPDEYQNRNGFETMACTVFATINILEILFKRVFGQDRDFSDRYLAICSGVTTEGGSPQTPIEIARKQSGLIDDLLLPFPLDAKVWDDYYNPIPMKSTLLSVGIEFLRIYKLGHEWVFTEENILEKQKLMMEALQYSPLGVSVYAWQKNELGLYIKGGMDNHWCVVYGYDEGNFWKVFDTYDNTHKKIIWKYDFGCAKRYHVEKNEVDNTLHEESKIGLLEWLKHLFGLSTSLGCNTAAGVYNY